jgi:hypothetical protein
MFLLNYICLSNLDAPQLAAGCFTGELWQRLANWSVEVFGLCAQLQKNSKGAILSGRIEWLCRQSVVYTIAGGTSEVMRNIIARRGLGLL